MIRLKETRWREGLKWKMNHGWKGGPRWWIDIESRCHEVWSWRMEARTRLDDAERGRFPFRIFEHAGNARPTNEILCYRNVARIRGENCRRIFINFSVLIRVCLKNWLWKKHLSARISLLKLESTPFYRHDFHFFPILPEIEGRFRDEQLHRSFPRNEKAGFEERRWSPDRHYPRWKL